MNTTLLTEIYRGKPINGTMIISIVMISHL